MNTRANFLFHKDLDQLYFFSSGWLDNYRKASTKW